MPRTSRRIPVFTESPTCETARGALCHGTVFRPTPEHRRLRLDFAKKPETLRAAGERLLGSRRG